MTISHIGYGLALIGGSALVVAYRSSKFRMLSICIQRALLLSGVFTVLWSVFGMTLAFYPTAIPELARTSFSNLKNGLGGAAIGLLILLMLDDEFRRIGQGKKE
jgi:hypothetical protein